MRFLKLLILLAFISSTQFTNAQMVEITKPYIQVNGMAEKEIIPNEIFLWIRIADKETKKGVDILENKMKKELKKIGIDLKHLVVQNAYSSLNQGFWSDKIETTRSYELKLSTAEETTKVLKMLKGIGIPSAGISRTYHSDMEKIKMDVKIEAIKNAKTKASTLMLAIDEKIGKPIRVIEVDYYGGPGYMQYRAKGYAAEAAMAESLPALEFKKIKIQYKVEVRFEIP